MLCLTSAQEDDIDSNKVLSDFIWAKIISVNNKNNHSPSSHSKHSNKKHNLNLVTIPYKPSSSFSSPYFSKKSSAISRRSSYSNSLNSIAAAASSSNYAYESANKYLSAMKANSASPRSEASKYGAYSAVQTSPTSSNSNSNNNPKTPAPQVKTSTYSGSESGKNYFVDVIATSPSSPSSSSKNIHESSKSLYDLVPMPTYGDFSKYTGGDEANNLYQKKRTVEIMPMIREGEKQSYGQQSKMEPQIIEVTPDDQPIQIVFRSTSTPVSALYFILFPNFYVFYIQTSGSSETSSHSFCSSGN